MPVYLSAKKCRAANPLKFPFVMPCTQQHPISFIVLREVMRNGGICRSSVQWLHTLVNHRAVHCIRLAMKIFMNFTRLDCTVPFLASYRHSVHSGITAFCCVHTYRRCRASGISRHGRICSRLGARQLSGTYVHSELPQLSATRFYLWISGRIPSLMRTASCRPARLAARY